jgi:hypothetical protein
VRIVAEVLNDRSAIGISVRFLQLFRCGIREPGEKHGLEIHIPKGVDDGFMSEDRVAIRRLADRERNAQRDDRTNSGIPRKSDDARQVERSSLYRHKRSGFFYRNEASAVGH